MHFLLTATRRRCSAKATILEVLGASFWDPWEAFWRHLEKNALRETIALTCTNQNLFILAKKDCHCTSRLPVNAPIAYDQERTDARQFEMLSKKIARNLACVNGVRHCYSYNKGAFAEPIGKP